MKVEIKLDKNAKEPYAVIVCGELDGEVLAAEKYLSGGEGVLTGLDGEKTVIIDRSELYMIRSEKGRTALICKEKRYESRMPLKDYENLQDFMRISKSCIVNLKKLKCVEPHFNGLMLLTLKNGAKDYISRKYLPDLKRYLGL